MLRQLINVVRCVLQVIRKYIKPLILIVSFVTFVWLLVDTAHRPEFVRHASKHSFRHNQTSAKAERWDEHSVQRFLDLLEIEFNLTRPGEPSWPGASCQPEENTLLFTAFAGSSLREHLWHYFSLVALRQSATRAGAGEYEVHTMLTASAMAELGQLFESLPEQVIDMQTIECYDIPSACILNDDTALELPDDGSQLYILNNNVLRLGDILDASVEALDEYFQINQSHLRKANDMLVQVRQQTLQQLGKEADAQVQFVGIHVSEQDGLPFEYYYRAISFQRKMYGNGPLVFVVLCEHPKGDICSLLNAPSENINVFQQDISPGVNFAVMKLCNHTIVSHGNHVFAALLRGTGVTVVNDNKDDASRNVGLEFASIKDHWYTIV